MAALRVVEKATKYQGPLVVAVLALLVALWLIARRDQGARSAEQPAASATESVPSGAPPPSERRCAIEIAVSSEGAPIPAARVVVHALDDGAEHFGAERPTTAAGSVRIDGLAPGAYEVAVSHAEFAPERKSVQLEAETTRVIFELARGVRIAARVVDRAGQPVASATVRAMAVESTDEFGVRQTDGEGRALLDGLPLRSYRLYVHSGRHRPRYSDTLEFGARAEERALTLVLEDGQRLLGRVVGPDRAAISGASVGSSDEATPITTTADDGRFELRGLGDDPINVYALAPGFAPTHVRGIRARGQTLEVSLVRPARIAVSVTAAAAPPSVELSVCKFDDYFKKELCIDRRIIRAPYGLVEIDGLPPGRHELVAQAARHATVRKPVELVSGETIALDLTLALAADQ